MEGILLYRKSPLLAEKAINESQEEGKRLQRGTNTNSWMPILYSLPCLDPSNRAAVSENFEEAEYFFKKWDPNCIWFGV